MTLLSFTSFASQAPYPASDSYFQQVVAENVNCSASHWDISCDQAYVAAATTGNSVEICSLNGYESTNGRIVWMPAFATDLRAAESGLFFEKFDDGTARIFGKVRRINNSNRRFAVSIWFNNQSTYAEWIAQGGEAKSPHLGPEHTWTFYSFDESKTSLMIGEGDWAGEVLQIFQMAGNNYGLQIGDGANDLNSNANGFSMWYDYTGTTSGHGDYNATIDCETNLIPPLEMFSLDCEDALRVDVQGVGMEGQQCASVAVDQTQPGDVEYIILETVWKGSNPPSSVTFVADGVNYQATAQIVVEGNGVDQGNKRAYRVEVPAASNVSVCRPSGSSNNLRALVAYVFRSNAGNVSAGSGEFVGYHLWQTSYTMNLTVPAHDQARDIVVTMPLTDMSDDGRIAEITVTAGPITKMYQLTGNTNGLSLNLTPLVLEDVPGDVTEIEVFLNSNPSNNPSSFLAAGLALADAQCETPEVEKICEVVGYNGPGTRHFIFFSAYGTNYTSSEEGLQFIQYEDGTAKMSGEIFALNNPNRIFEVVLYFNNKQNYAEFTAAGNSPKIPGFDSVADAETWTYYSFDDTRPNVLTGRGDNEGVYLFLRNMDGTNHGLQIGSNGANDKNSAFGMSTWFSYSGTSNGHGDLNANLLCAEPECEVVCPADLELDCTSQLSPDFTGEPTLLCEENNNCAREAGEFNFEFQPWGGSTEGWSFGTGWQIGDGCAPSCGTFPNVFIDFTNFHTAYNSKLKSPVYEACCTDEVFVSFCMQQDLFGSSNVPGYLKLQYRVNGGSWATVATYTSVHGSTINYNDTYELPGAAGNSFEIRFRAHGNGSSGYTMGGWGIDNVRIFGESSGCEPTSGEVEIDWDYSDEFSGDCPKVITRTFTGTYQGESFECEQTITVVDEEAPVFTQVPDDVSYACITEVELSVAEAIDNCSDSVNITYNDVESGEDCDLVIERTFTATDDCGNSAYYTQIITVIDDVPPYFTSVPEPVMGNCEDVLTDEMAVAEDDCSDVTVTFHDIFGEYSDSNCGMFRTQTPGGWGAPAAGQNPGSYRDANFAAAFPNGLTIGCNNTLTLTSAAAVQAFLPAGGTPASLPAGDLVDPVNFSNGLANHLVALKLSLGFDANDPDFGDAFGFLGNLIVNNGAFQGMTVSEVVAIADEIVGGCSNQYSASAITEVITMINENYVDGAVDNGNLDCVNEDICGFFITRVFTATDECGNTAVATTCLAVVDTEAPEIVCPEDITIECTDPITPDFTGEASATDDCSDPVVTYEDGPITGSCPSTFERTWTAIDACGNEVSCVQTITIVDTTAPELIGVPDDITIECTDDIPTANVSVVDNCDDNVTVTVNLSEVQNDCGSVITRIWSAVDACGNGVTATQVITVVDTTAPVIVCPANYTVNCDNGSSDPEFAGEATATDDCSDVTITYEDGVVPEECPATFERVWTATDACGNTASCTQLITINDFTSPVIVCPDDITIDCTSAITPDVTGMATATDDCSEPVITYVDGPMTGDCPYTIERIWTATDACGNASSSLQIITIIDTEAPEISGEDSVLTIECDQSIVLEEPTVTDNCDENIELEFNLETVVGDCAGERTETYTWTAVDACGNSAVRTIVVNYVDTTAPTLVGVPQNITIECDQPVPTAAVSAFDNCDENVSVTLSASTQLNECGETLTRTWTATDDCGNTASLSQTVTIVDTTAPVAVYVPMSVEIECDDEIPSDQPIFSDNCDDDLEISAISGINNVTECGYTIERSWTATDDCGNAITVSQTIIISDTQAPVLIDLPENETVDCNAIPAPAGVSAIDNCDENPTVSFSETVSSGCPYTIIRTWVAMDECGNTSSASQTITVVDNEAPVLIGVPENIDDECGSIPAPIEVTAVDNCDDNVQVTMSQETIGNECPLTVVRTWTAVDACGNSVSASQTISINDTEAPVFTETPQATITVECDAIPSASELDVEVTDNCDLNPSVTYSAEVINTPGTGFDCGYQIIRTWTATDLCGNAASFVQTVNVIDTTAPVLVGVPADATAECDNVPTPPVVTAFDNCYEGDILVTLSESIVEQECGYLLIRTWSAADDCENIASATQTLTVVDTTAPVVVSTPSTITIECDEDLPTDAPVFDDNCDENLTVTSNDVITEQACGYLVTRTWTATDNCGNSKQASRQIFVIDTTAPVLMGVPEDASVSCDAIPAVAQVSAEDNCDDDVQISFSETISTGICPYTITRTWTATDNCGNFTQASQVLTVVDDVPPSISGSIEDVTVDCNSIPGLPMVSVSDNCDDDVDLSFSEVITPLDECGYQITRTWVATDNCENQDTKVQVITVIDTEAPEVVTQPQDLDLSCTDEVPFEAPSFTDDCDENLEIGFSEQIVPGDCANNFTIVRTWTAIDDCGNAASVTQNISVSDNEAPILIGVPDDLTVECDAIPSVAQVSAIDNCDPSVQVFFNEVVELQECGFIITRTWSASDDCENGVSASQVITVVDTTAPVVIFEPADITINCDDEVPNATPIFDDNCDDDLTLLAASSISMLECGYEIQRSWTAIDNCGNQTSVSQTITVVDLVAPVLIGVPANATVECDAIPTVALVTAEDNCDENPVVTFVETVSEETCPQTITRTWTATDDCGNESTLSQVLTVVDTTDPVLIGVPADTTVECDAIPAPAVVTATDNCSLNLIVGFNESIQELACGAVITRTWSVSDDCNNFVQASQVITVTDTEAPVLIGVPADATVECDAVPAVATVTATDNCSDDLFVAFSETVLPLECGYQLTRTWTVIDDCNNQASASQVLTVVDNTAPVILNGPQNVTVECDQVPGTINLQVVDNCDPMPIVTSSESIELQDCGYIITRTYVATDNCGNSATHIQLITVTDTEAPVITGVPDDITIECGEAVPAPGQVTATDNCDPMPEISVSEESVQLECGSQIIRTYTATDECGNQSTAEQIITISDFTPPVFDTEVEDIIVQCEDLTIAPTVTASDNCSSFVQVTLTETVGEGCPYVIERTWTATDDCGNEATLTQLVTVIDEEAPVFEDFPYFISLACDEVEAYMPEAFDNCSPNVTVEVVQELTFSGGCLGVLARTYRAVDQCGNETFAEQLIQQVDNVAPELFNVPESITLECGDEIPPAADDIFATDNCTDVNITFTEVQTNEFCPYEIIRTWTAVDQCGNITVGEQVITVTVDTDTQDVTIITYPNPMDDRFTLEFTVPRDADVVARVYDMTGREVLNIFDGKADARRFYQLGYDNLGWTAGAYIIMMTVDGKVYNHRMIVTQTR